MTTNGTDPKREWQEELGERIKELRERLGFSHSEFAKYLSARMVDGGSVSSSSLRRWEHGEVAPGSAAWASMARIARTRDLEFYLTGISRRDQYAETFANEEFLPESGFLVLLEIKTVPEKVSRIGAFAKVLNVIAKHHGRIVRLTTWGKHTEQAQRQLLVLFDLPLVYALEEDEIPTGIEDGSPTDIGALRDEIAGLDVVAYASVQVRTRDAVVFPVAGSPPEDDEDEDGD